MTDADLDGLERLATAATPGPWRADAEKQDNPLTGDYDGCRDYVVSADDDTTIAHLGPCGGCERACSRRVANSDNPPASLRPDEDVFRLGDACYPDRRADRNAGFIAAANPAVVLALVAGVRRLRAENDRLRARVAELEGPQIVDKTAAAGGTSGPYRVR